MDKLEHVFDGTPDNFNQLVLENSHKGVVLVNFWTPAAGPCFKLWQVLESLTAEYEGRFLLVNVNTDTQKQLARSIGITSVPTVKIYKKGAAVESIHGAQSEMSMREALNRHIPAMQDTKKLEAIRVYQAGSTDQALAILAEASQQHPEDLSLHATAIKLMFRSRRFADITDYYTNLPEAARKNSDITHLVIHAELIRMAEEAPPVEELDQQLRDDPEDYDALLTRSALAVVQDDPEYALECLFYLFQQDRNFKNGFAQKAMLSIFSLLGSHHELTRAFQQRMREILH